MERIDYLIMVATAAGLLLVGMLFLPSGPTEFTLNNAYADACNQLKQQACDQYAVLTITALTSGRTSYTLGNLCALRGMADSAQCAVSCGCLVNARPLTTLSETPLTVYSNSPINEGVNIEEPEYEEESVTYDEI